MASGYNYGGAVTPSESSGEKKKPEKEIILFYADRALCYTSNFISFAMWVSIIMLGHITGSTFVEVFGACFWLLGMFAWMNRILKRAPSTPQEAADYLKREYGVTARE